MCWYSVPPSHHLADVRHRQLVCIILENSIFSDPISHSSHWCVCPAPSHSLRRKDRLRRASSERVRQLNSASKPAVWPWLTGLTSLSFIFSSWTCGNIGQNSGAEVKLLVFKSFLSCFLYSIIYGVHMCMVEAGYTSACMWKVREQLKGGIFLSHLMGPRDQTWAW